MKTKQKANMQTRTLVKLTKDNAIAGVRVMRTPKQLQAITGDRRGTLQPIPDGCLPVFPDKPELVAYRRGGWTGYWVYIHFDGRPKPEHVYLQYLAIAPDEVSHDSK